MIIWLGRIVGPKFALPVLIVAGVLFALVFFAVVQSCTSDDTDQVEQTTRSSEAIANAAENAVATVINANERDASIDEIVSQAEKEIDNAPNAAVARAATIRAVCLLAEYRNDPACAVR